MPLDKIGTKQLYVNKYTNYISDLFRRKTTDSRTGVHHYAKETIHFQRLTDNIAILRNKLSKQYI